MYEDKDDEAEGDDDQGQEEYDLDIVAQTQMYITYLRLYILATMVWTLPNSNQLKVMQVNAMPCVCRLRSQITEDRVQSLQHKQKSTE